ncbi:MAG TPA: hypothetical protein HA362_02520 [Nanoarchaeota archaeon]|nr:hypothetical protein [Nanoarchaeota archaeon]
MNKKALSQSLAALLAAGSMAIAGCELNEKPHAAAPKPHTFITIPAEECRPVCGGEICYGDVRYQAYRGRGTEAGIVKAITGYTISQNGFDNWTILHTKMIIAGECVFYKLSAGDELVLEQLE